MKLLLQNSEPKLLAAGVPQPPAKTADRIPQMVLLPLTLTVEIPIVGFTLRGLLHLAKGATLESACDQKSDVPLRVNHTLIGWAEFEVTGDRLAVRITDIA